jgi:hypothetical protein
VSAETQYIVITTIRGEFANELPMLAQEFSAASGPDFSVGIRIAAPSGPPPPEVLHIAIKAIEDYAFAKAVDSALHLVKTLWRRRKERGDEKRQIGVVIYGPKGEPLKKVLLDESGEPIPSEERMGPLGVRTGSVNWLYGPKSTEDDPPAAKGT